MKYEKYKLKNSTLHLIKTDKFKNIQIEVKLRNKVIIPDITKRSLLPYVLKAGCEKYNNKQKMNQYLEKLYGASFYVATNRNGLVSTMNFSLRIVDVQYIKDKDLLCKAVLFLKDALLCPLGTSEFKRSLVSEEKRLLIDEINSLKDDKMRYALEQFNGIMFKDELQKYRTIGTITECKKITGQNLFEYYQKCLVSDAVDIIVTGDIDFEEIKNLVSQNLDFGHNEEYPVIDYEDKVVKRVKKVVRYDKINQSHLVIGYRTKTRIGDSDHFPMVLFNAILGGYAHSLLFMNVREKASLAYSVFSRNNAFKGFISIWAGVDGDKKEEALNIILNQIDKVKKGDLSDEIIDMTKKALVNDLLESMDSLGSISQKAYSDMLLNRDFDINYFIEKINSVTKKEIIAASKKIRMDTIFFLLGGKNGED